MSHNEIERILKELTALHTKCDGLKACLDEQKKQIEALMPVRDGLTVFQNLIKFFKYVGIPTGVVIATIYWFIKKV
jgi:hypothetical protein